MFDAHRIWGEQTWPDGPWGDITIAPGERCCLLGIDGGIAEIELATGRIVRTVPRTRVDESPSLAVSADGRTTATRVGETVEVRRTGEEEPVVLPLGSTVWISPDGSLLLVRAPWDRARSRDGPATLLRWRDRRAIHSTDDGGADVVAWIGDRVAFADRHQILHLWDGDGRVQHASIPGHAVGLVPVTIDGEELLLTALRTGRSGRTELRSLVDGSVVRVLSTTHSITGAVTSDARVVTVQGLIVSLATGATLREITPVSPIGRIVLSRRGDRAVLGHGGRLAVFDLGRWDVVRPLDESRPAHAFAADFLPDGEHIVVVEPAGRVSLLDAEGRVQWSHVSTPDPAWQGTWELPSWSTGAVRCTDDAIVVELEWIQRGPVEGDGHQDYEGRRKVVVLGRDGTPLDRAPPADAAPPEVTASIEKRPEEREVVVVRRDGALVRELDVTLAYGRPTSVAIARDASQLLIGTRRGLLLGYR